MCPNQSCDAQARTTQKPTAADINCQERGPRTQQAEQQLQEDRQIPTCLHTNTRTFFHFLALRHMSMIASATSGRRLCSNRLSCSSLISCKISSVKTGGACAYGRCKQWGIRLWHTSDETPPTPQQALL